MDVYCPMIHGGLNIDLRDKSGNLGYNQCCLSSSPLIKDHDGNIKWYDPQLNHIRNINLEGKWSPDCWECEKLEKAGVKSFRKSMIEKLGCEKDSAGPRRIDLLFDRNCNLACRTCGEWGSTLWTKHLKDNNLPYEYHTQFDNFAKIKSYLESLDLSNLEMLQFCGGETLLSPVYWQTAEFLAELVPDAKSRIEIGFQTNGTQSISEKWYPIIEKFKLVKLLCSIDGIGEKFDYLRWPASWNQTVDNLFSLRAKLPSNVMFFVQETTSCLNLYHFEEVGEWVKQNFSANREGDATDHSTQLAIHSYLNCDNITQEYRDALQGKRQSHVISTDWCEQPERIKMFIRETDKFDRLRHQDWKKTFPEVAEFYRRYL